jgi:hypothetical protein
MPGHFTDCRCSRSCRPAISLGARADSAAVLLQKPRAPPLRRRRKLAHRRPRRRRRRPNQQIRSAILVALLSTDDRTAGAAVRGQAREMRVAGSAAATSLTAFAARLTDGSATVMADERAGETVIAFCSAALTAGLTASAARLTRGRGTTNAVGALKVGGAGPCASPARTTATCLAGTTARRALSALAHRGSQAFTARLADVAGTTASIERAAIHAGSRLVPTCACAGESAVADVWVTAGLTTCAAGRARRSTVADVLTRQSRFACACVTSRAAFCARGPTGCALAARTPGSGRRTRRSETASASIDSSCTAHLPDGATGRTRHALAGAV